MRTAIILCYVSFFSCFFPLISLLKLRGLIKTLPAEHKMLLVYCAAQMLAEIASMMMGLSKVSNYPFILVVFPVLYYILASVLTHKHYCFFEDEVGITTFILVITSIACLIMDAPGKELKIFGSLFLMLFAVKNILGYMTDNNKDLIYYISLAVLFPGILHTIAWIAIDARDLWAPGILNSAGNIIFNIIITRGMWQRTYSF